MAIPVRVSVAPPAALIAFAIPKSRISGSPSQSMMFSGLMSRCTTPWRCAKSRAAASCRVRRTVSGAGMRLSLVIRSRRVSPTMCGIT